MIKIALTGTTGNMGTETLFSLMTLDFVEKVKILVLNTAKDKAIAKKFKKIYRNRLDVQIGDLAVYEDCEKLIEDCDYILNLAAVIPPKSDKYPNCAKACNVDGVTNLITALEKKENQPKFIHISTVAVYGNRNHKHPWGRVGDPLLPSVYDCYASFKVEGERRVLESKIKTWAVLRQTAMLHKNMLTDNMKDGLMFHTCYNTPLEWVTARDSGRLLANIIAKDVKGETTDFWYKVFNIGGGAPNRCTGFDTFDQGFRIIGGNGEKFLNPSWNSVRNFHGLWFSDSDQLEEMFHFQKETTIDYWQEILIRHPYYKVAKILPARLIKKLAIQRLLSDKNAPRKWIKAGEKGKVKAYFGSEYNIQCLPEKWENYPLLCKGQLADGDLDYEALRDFSKIKENGFLLSHGYDESKKDEELSFEDFGQAAKFRGGKCLSSSSEGNPLYKKALWECHQGHRFEANPYTILKAGHWCPHCTKVNVWDFDMQAKHNPFYAQVWYDSHALRENTYYYFDDEYRAKFEIKEE